MTKNIKQYLYNILFILIVSFISLLIIFKGNFSQLILLPFYLIVFLLFIAFIPHFIEAEILKKFSNLYNENYTFKDGFINALIGSFFSGITPFSSGGQFAQVYIFKKQGLSYTNASVILLLHFILYQTCLVIYTLFILLFKFHQLSQFYHGFLSLALLGFLINFCVIVCLYLGATSYKFQFFLTDFILKMACKFCLIKDYENNKCKLEKSLKEFRDGLKIIRTYPLEMVKIALLFIIKLTVLYSLPYFIFLCLGCTISYLDCFAICSFVYLITGFIPLPGASGGSEGTFVILFSAIASTPLISSAMFIWRFITYYFTIFVGCIIFILYIKTSKKGEKLQ